MAGVQAGVPGWREEESLTPGRKQKTPDFGESSAIKGRGAQFWSGSATHRTYTQRDRNISKGACARHAQRSREGAIFAIAAPPALHWCRSITATSHPANSRFSTWNARSNGRLPVPLHSLHS